MVLAADPPSGSTLQLWLPLLGTVVAAVTAGVVALIIDARRRADAERVRHDDARREIYVDLLAKADTFRNWLNHWSSDRSTNEPKAAAAALAFITAADRATMLASGRTRPSSGRWSGGRDRRSRG